MSNTMDFLGELPAHLQDKIIDCLHVKERARLGCITSKYKRDIDKHLAVLHIGLKKNIFKKERLSSAVKTFLITHYKDPTVIEFANSLNIALPNPRNKEIEPTELTFTAFFKEWLSNGSENVQPPPPPTIEDSKTVHRGEIRLISEIIACFATPHKFNQIINIPIYEPYIDVSSIVFDTMSQKNEKLFESILNSNHPFIKDKIRFITQPLMIPHYAYKEYNVSLFLKYGNLSLESKEAIFANACDKLDYGMVMLVLKVL